MSLTNGIVQSWTKDATTNDFGSVNFSIDDLHSVESNLHFYSQQQHPQLSLKETKGVRRLRLGMIIILIISATAAGALSFWYLRRTEHNKFQTMFHDDAQKLNQGLRSNLLNIIASLDLLSTVTITHASGSGEKFPFTTVPHFANIASKTLSMSAAINVISHVFVDGQEQRMEWEDYAWKNQYIVNESLRIMETDPNFHGDVPWNISIIESLHGDYDPVPYNES
jgi:hypothetical protein